MDGWMAGQKIIYYMKKIRIGWMDKKIYEKQMVDWMDKKIDGWLDGQKKKQMDGWMENGWI